MPKYGLWNAAPFLLTSHMSASMASGTMAIQQGPVRAAASKIKGLRHDQRIQGACIPPKAADLRALLQLLLRTQPSTSKPTVHSKRTSLSVHSQLRLNEQLSAASNHAWAPRRSEQRLSRRRQFG